MGRDLHPNLNSSNLASPCLEKGNESGSHLPQFGSHSAVIGCNDYHLLTQLYHAAAIVQGRRYDMLVMPLQDRELSGFARKQPQFGV